MLLYTLLLTLLGTVMVVVTAATAVGTVTAALRLTSLCAVMPRGSLLLSS